MYLEKIKLTSFRNYDNLEINVSKNINVFFGNNAEGKTNIIEAIYILGITKSYRTLKDTECIKFGKEFFRIESEYKEGKNISKTEIYLNNSKKIIKNDDIKIEKYSDYIGTYPIVLFSPENMDIVKGSPKNRRRFLDILIGQISKKYIIYLQEYNKLIKMKNNLLKNEKNSVDNNYLDILDSKIAEKIHYICLSRQEYVDKVEKHSINLQEKLSKGEEKIELKYISEFNKKSIDGITNILLNNRESDFLKKTSTKGLGHDDISIYVNNLEVNTYGSQGQNRTAVLSLKLAEFEILKEEKEKNPIILLDDVFSELDKDRINYLLEYIKEYQVFITTTEVESIKNLENKTLYKVESGRVEKK